MGVALGQRDHLRLPTVGTGSESGKTEALRKTEGAGWLVFITMPGACVCACEPIVGAAYDRGLPEPHSQ